MKIVKTACRACIASCAVLAHVKNGRVIKIEGNPESPMSQGGLCAKGMAGIQALYHPNRNKYPMRRVGERGQNQWERITWDEAITEIATKLIEIDEKYGSECVAVSTGGGGNPHFSNVKRFGEAINTPNVWEPGCAQCYLPRMGASQLSNGMGKPNNLSFSDSNGWDYYFTDSPVDSLVLWGTDPSNSSVATGGRALAELMASKRTQLCASWAIQRAHHGEMPYWAIVNFACILGNIGLPGQGVGFSWHYGGGGTAQSGGTAPTGMSQGRNPVKKICPASRISEMLLNPGKEFTYNGSTYTFPLVKLIYNAGNNVFSHQQDLNELARAMHNVDTVICHEPWWNGSARWADIVLGATTTLERNDISSAGTYSIDKVYAMKQVVAPQHDALDDFEIFRRLAELFGVEYAFTEGKTPMDYVKDAYAASTASKHTPFEKFWADGMARIPVPPEAHKWVRHGDFRADPEKNPLHTHSGKVEMYSTTIAKMDIPDMPPMPTWQEPGEYLGNAKKGQVHVVSPHPYWRLHSQLNNSEKLRKRYTVQTREPLTISVQDAKANGIRDGDLVELHNARGALVVGARVSDKIMPGVVSLYEGAWPQLDSKGRCNNGLVNFLTSSRGSSGLTQATTANTCIASIRKCTDADPGGTKAFDPPKITKSDIKFDDAFFQLDRASVLREKATASLSPAEKIYYQRCSVCHGPRDPGQFTEKQWLGITPSMFQRAGLNDDEQKIVLDFLLKNAKH